MSAPDPNDPKGLIRESYRIEGITMGECRSIFLDWAMSIAAPDHANPAIEALLDTYGRSAPDHPMTTTLREGLQKTGPARRKGGRAGRISG